MSLLFIFSAFQVKAENKVYIGLEISETKTSSAVKFSLKSAALVYGDYDTKITPYNEDLLSKRDYILEAYVDKEKASQNYYISSSRIIMIDTADGGGVMELNSGTILAFLPFDMQNITSAIKIDNNGKKTAFIDLPVEEFEKQYTSLNFCKKENESGEYLKNECCSGLIPATQKDGSFVCVVCGDKICSQYESYKSCYEDCIVAEKKPENALGSLSKNKILIWIISIVVFVVLVLVLAMITISRKKKKEMQEYIERTRLNK